MMQLMRERLRQRGGLQLKTGVNSAEPSAADLILRAAGRSQARPR
jgi:hypothetical protein